MSRPPDLEARVTARKDELIAEIIEHKKNSSRVGAAEAIDRLKARLSELAHIVKEGIVDDWANLGPKARTRLDAWIAK
jgi:prephenate dehydrogenase